jgi:hypothetical protein
MSCTARYVRYICTACKVSTVQFVFSQIDALQVQPIVLIELIFFIFARDVYYLSLLGWVYISSCVRISMSITVELFF